jgi:hypothetical protein
VRHRLERQDHPRPRDRPAQRLRLHLNGSFIGDRKIFVVEGRPEKDRPKGRFASGESAKPSFTPKPPAAEPGFVERRSGKERRGQAGAPAAGADRRDAPTAPISAVPAAKPWGKKPFDAAKKPWEKKPFDAAKKPWEKKPFDRKPPARGPKWTPKEG